MNTFLNQNGLQINTPPHATVMYSITWEPLYPSEIAIYIYSSCKLGLASQVQINILKLRWRQKHV